MEQEQDLTRPQIHLVALPHTLLTREYDWCAYTAKLRRFTHMLTLAGYTPVVYGPDVHDCADGTVYEQIVDEGDRVAWFGAPEWDRTQVFSSWDAEAPHFVQMNMRAAVAIASHWRDGDILGLIGGACQALVPQLLRTAGLKPLIWEWGIGYSGVLPDSVRTFESYAWAHHVAGLTRQDDIRFFDTVVPNCFDTADFNPSTQPGEYLLFVGRPTARKGLPILTEIAKHTSIPLKIAGQPGVDIPGAEHVGIVTGKEKADLFAGACALLAPTTYLEPFGGVVVEAALSGTPAITTDWGAFTETVQHGVTGWRARTLAEFMFAIDNIDRLDRSVIHAEALSRYTLPVGSLLYDGVISKLVTLRQAGWYQLGSDA